MTLTKDCINSILDYGITNYFFALKDKRLDVSFGNGEKQ